MQLTIWIGLCITVAVNSAYSTAFRPQQVSKWDKRARAKGEYKPRLLEKWSYTEIRKDAFMFSWLYYTSHPEGYRKRPWILWLQGGPGNSGTALGNFAEFGPKNTSGMPREYSWVRTANLLFVDSPVGCGYSYLQGDAKLPNNTEEISQDLIAFLKVFLEEKAEFKRMPLYIFGQSYGAKMAVALGYYLHKAIEQNEVDCDLVGLGIGNGFFSPLHTFTHWPEILKELSLIDSSIYKDMKEAVDKMRNAYEEDPADYNAVGNQERVIIDQVMRMDVLLNIYNFLDVSTKSPETASSRKKRDLRVFPQVHPYHPMMLGSIYEFDWSPFMEGQRDKLKIIPENVNWTYFNEALFSSLHGNGDLFVPALDMMDFLLNHTEVEIAVYEGQLDLVYNPAGVLDAIETLTWPGITYFKAAERKVFSWRTDNAVELIVKAYKNLKFYWIFGAGHSVPADRPELALKMVDRILSGIDK